MRLQRYEEFLEYANLFAILIKIREKNEEDSQAKERGGVNGRGGVHGRRRRAWDARQPNGDVLTHVQIERTQPEFVNLG